MSSRTNLILFLRPRGLPAAPPGAPPTRFLAALACCAALAACPTAAHARMTFPGMRRHMKRPLSKPMAAKPRAAAPLLPDGAMLVNAHGKLFFNKATGRWSLIFSNKKIGRPRSIRLLPCLMLQGLSKLGGKGALVTVSGEVTAFQGHNYLLISPATGVGGPVNLRRHKPVTSAKTARPTGARRPRTHGPQKPRPSANDVLNSLLRQDVSQPVMPAPESYAIPSGIEKVGSRSVPLLREGDYIANRIARVLPPARRPMAKGRREGKGNGRPAKSSSGYYRIIFDSDGRVLHDPPLRLLPCHLLSVMLRISHNGRLPKRFRVSGLVTQFHKRNYLLLDFVERPLHLRRF